MRHGSKKDQRGWAARTWSVRVANRKLRRAVRLALKTLNLVEIEALAFPTPVGGWWDTFADVLDARIPRAVVNVKATEELDGLYPVEPEVPEYPDRASVTDDEWSMADQDDDYAFLDGDEGCDSELDPDDSYDYHFDTYAVRDFDGDFTW